LQVSDPTYPPFFSFALSWLKEAKLKRNRMTAEVTTPIIKYLLLPISDLLLLTIEILLTGYLN
jgi:hypothetical protein